MLRHVSWVVYVLLGVTSVGLALAFSMLMKPDSVAFVSWGL